jgi:hypothetical protein
VPLAEPSGKWVDKSELKDLKWSTARLEDRFYTDQHIPPGGEIRVLSVRSQCSRQDYYIVFQGSGDMYDKYKCVCRLEGTRAEAKAEAKAYVDLKIRANLMSPRL